MEKSAKGMAESREADSMGGCLEAILAKKEAMGFSKKAQELSEEILPMLIMLKG